MVSPCLNVFLLYIPSCTIHALELWILSTTAYPLILIHTHLCNFVTACKSWPICSSMKCNAYSLNKPSTQSIWQILNAHLTINTDTVWNNFHCIKKPYSPLTLTYVKQRLSLLNLLFFVPFNFFFFFFLIVLFYLVVSRDLQSLLHLLLSCATILASLQLIPLPAITILICSSHGPSTLCFCFKNFPCYSVSPHP
jgi:hypothetical protein